MTDLSLLTILQIGDEAGLRMPAAVREKFGLAVGGLVFIDPLVTPSPGELACWHEVGNSNAVFISVMPSASVAPPGNLIGRVVARLEKL